MPGTAAVSPGDLGLAGAAITVEHFARVIERTRRLADGNMAAGPVWLNEND